MTLSIVLENSDGDNETIRQIKQNKEGPKMFKVFAVSSVSVMAAGILALGYFADCSTTTDNYQNVSAYLDQEGNTIAATVDLRGGYSCEFTKGAVYLYDEEVFDDTDPVAIAITLDEDVYDVYLAKAVSDPTRRYTDNGIIFAGENNTIYICRVGNDAYFGIFAEDTTKAEMASIVSRFSLKRAA